MSQKEPEEQEVEATEVDGIFPGVGGGTDDPPSDGPSSAAAPAAPTPSADSSLDSQSSQFFLQLDSSVAALQRRAQQLINQVNDSRRRDDAISSSFRDSLLLQVSGQVKQLEEWLLQLYGLHNELIQQRVQELEEVMERVAQLMAELRQVCSTVEAAYRELCLQHEA